MECFCSTAATLRTCVLLGEHLVGKRVSKLCVWRVCAWAYVCPFNKRSSRRNTGKKGQKGGMKEKEGELLPKTFQFPSVAEVNLLCQIPLPRVLFHELKCDFIRASVRLSLLIFHAEGK